MVSLRHAFVNPEGRTLARPSYPTPDLRSAYPGPNCVGTDCQPCIPLWPLPGKAAVAADMLCRQSLTLKRHAEWPSDIGHTELKPHRSDAVFTPIRYGRRLRI